MDKTQSRDYIQLGIACFLTLAGIVMLLMGIWLEPQGEISSSVLVAYGEVSSFAAAVLGIENFYRIKYRHGGNKD